MLSKTLLLAGSGEFTPAMETVDSYVLSFANSANRKIAVLPTAAGQEPDFEKWVKMAQEHFAKFGYEVFGVNILNRNDAENYALVDSLREASVIYISGGDPGYLLSSIKDTYLLKTIVALYEQGTVLCGSSAGAWVLGNFVLSNVYQMMSGAKDAIWESGAHLVDYNVVPHFSLSVSEYKPTFDLALSEAPKQVASKILGIEENTALLITDDVDAMVLGESSVHVIINGTDTIYRSGSILSL